VAASASSAHIAGTMNGTVLWPPDVYIKPEVEILPEPPARPDVVVSSNSRLTDRTSTTSLGRSSVNEVCKNRDERSSTTFDEQRDAVRSQSKMMPTSPDIDRRTAVIKRRLAADAGGGYKYKDNIKRRFCSESDTQTPSHVDARSYSGSSDGASSAPDSPPSSPGVPLHSATVRDDCSYRNVPVHTAAGERSPGFVLHPSGAYYLPMVASTAQVRALLSATAPASSLDGRQGPAVVCHPVSIPVRFTGSGTATTEVMCVDDVASTDEHCPVNLVKCPSLLQLERV